jgi:GT2 family glycosyltransferase
MSAVPQQPEQELAPDPAPELLADIVSLPLPLPDATEDEAPAEPRALSMSLIVPATDFPSTLEACLQAIRSSIDPPTEIIVVNDAHGEGAAAARNKGAALATGDVLVFVDADVVVHPDAISRLHAHLEASPQTAAVFGSYDDVPAGGTVSGFRNLLHHHVHQASGGRVGTFWAGLGAVRREAFERVGGFDSDRLWLEDVDLGIRLTEAGEEIVLDPAILGRHLKEWSLRTMVRTDFHHRAVPWVDLMIKHGHSSTDLNLGWRHRASALAVLVIALAAITHHPVVAAGAVAAFVVLNLTFYRTLRRRQGLLRAVAGVGLHALHHAVAIAAVLYAVARHLPRHGRLPRRESTEPAETVASTSSNA